MQKHNLQLEADLNNSQTRTPLGETQLNLIYDYQDVKWLLHN